MSEGIPGSWDTIFSKSCANKQTDTPTEGNKQVNEFRSRQEETRETYIKRMISDYQKK